MSYDQTVRHLGATAARCRELAEAASDGEVAAILRQAADDIDAALPILQANLSTQDNALYQPL